MRSLFSTRPALCLTEPQVLIVHDNLVSRALMTSLPVGTHMHPPTHPPMHTCIQTHAHSTHVSAHTRTHDTQAHTHRDMCKCTHVPTHPCTHTHTDSHTLSTQTHACAHTRRHVHTHAQMCVQAHIHTYACMHTPLKQSCISCLPCGLVGTLQLSHCSITTQWDFLSPSLCSPHWTESCDGGHICLAHHLNSGGQRTQPAVHSKVR